MWLNLHFSYYSSLNGKSISSQDPTYILVNFVIAAKYVKLLTVHSYHYVIMLLKL